MAPLSFHGRPFSFRVSVKGIGVNILNMLQKFPALSPLPISLEQFLLW
jgi:hypothetical protein